jgi:chromosomal replication initiator protein
MKAGDEQARVKTIEAIQGAVADLFRLSVEELRQQDTRRAVTVPRQIAIYLAKQITDASLPEIGRHFGGRHHTTVMYSIARIEESRRTDSVLDNAISNLLKRLTTGCRQ